MVLRFYTRLPQEFSIALNSLIEVGSELSDVPICRNKNRKKRHGLVFSHPLRDRWSSLCGSGYRSTPPKEFGEITRQFGYSILSDEAIAAIIHLESIVELGAGNGYNAKLITEAAKTAGKSIRYNAFDICQEHWSIRHFSVGKGGIEVLKRYTSSALFLCWPNGDNPFAHEATKTFRELGGSKLAFVGEPKTIEIEISIDHDEKKPGRMGNNEFHDELAEFWNVEKRVNVHRWPGFQDRLVIYNIR